MSSLDPNTWCEEEIEVAENPLKRIMCFVIDLLELITPLTKYLKTLVDIFVEMVFMNNFYTEIFIIISPILPIAYLLVYFLETV